MLYIYERLGLAGGCPPPPMPVFIPRAIILLPLAVARPYPCTHIISKPPPPQFHIEKSPPGRKFPLLLHLIPLSLLSVLVAGITFNATIRLTASL